MMPTNEKNTTTLTMEVLPQGAAALYIKNLGLNPVRDDVDRLVDLFRMYYVRGGEDATKHTPPPKRERRHNENG